MTTRKRILYVSPFPYSLSSGDGGATVCAAALRLLQAHFEIGMVCFFRGTEGEHQAAAQLQSSLKWFRSVPLHITKADVVKAKLRSFALNPEQATYFNKSDMRAAIQQEIERIKPDVVICQFPQMAQFITEVDVCPLTVMDVQDAFSISSFRKISSSHGAFKRIYYFFQWLGWIRYERSYYPKFKQVWTLSAQDGYGLTAFSPTLQPRVVGLPLDDLETSPEKPTCQHRSRFRIGFIGSFSHPPNLEALKFICTQLVPRVNRSALDLEFAIAGRNPPDHLRRQAPSNVHFLGFVDRLSDFYDNVDIVIAPLLSGGGVKVKVAEAMLHGKAIITTAIGAEGLDVQSGKELLVANGADEFADHIEALLTSHDLKSQIETQSRRHAAARLGREQWLARVLHNLSQTV
jgi:glycosyltransferase involved in cell wall biosynthesis